MRFNSRYFFMRWQKKNFIRQLLFFLLITCWR